MTANFAKAVDASAVTESEEEEEEEDGGGGGGDNDDRGRGRGACDKEEEEEKDEGGDDNLERLSDTHCWLPTSTGNNIIIEIKNITKKI